MAPTHYADVEATGFDMNGLCRFIKEAGEAMQAMAKALEDGRVTKPEARECLKELMDLMQVCMGLMAKCRLEVIDG